jgi:hypothetical protein
MAGHTFKDWMDAPDGSGELTAQQEIIIAEYVSCKDLMKQAECKKIG